jgi:hypothetical protein
MYVHPATGEAVPSVTTVIHAGLPKPALVGWAAKMAAEYAVNNWAELDGMHPDNKLMLIKGAHQRSAQTSADVGDAVHKLIECYQTGQPFPILDKTVNAFASQFINFMLDVQPTFLESEVTLWSRTHGYAGTADWIAEIGNKIILGDNKTGKRLYPEVGLQLSALGHADFILRPDGTELEIKPPDGYAALHLRPRSWKLTEIDMTEECFSAFLCAKYIWHWSKNVAPEVLDGR